MVRLTPGALNSQRMEQRPAGLPTHLYVHGGLGHTRTDAVLFLDSRPVRVPSPAIAQLASLRKA